jgi:hypothetical protein
MDPRRAIIAGLACLALLAACTTAPGTSTPGASSVSTPGASSGSTPGASPLGAPIRSAAASLTGPGIEGTIALHSERETRDDVIHQVVSDEFDATIQVRLARDPSAADELYVDAGSTYTVNALTTTERQLGDCLAVSESTIDAEHAFTDQPTYLENHIEARVDRGAKTVAIDAFFTWVYTVDGNDCDGRGTYTGENGTGLACPFLGLVAKLVEGTGSDQIDTECRLPGGDTTSGVLTLTR